MKICFFCDMHLPADRNALQYDVLRWAIDDISKSCSDCVAFAGDVTCNGDGEVYEFFLNEMRKLRLPFLYIPGNSDLRCAKTREEIKHRASPCENTVGGSAVYALNDCDRTIAAEQLSLIEKADESSVVFMHHPPKEHDGDSVARLMQWRDAHPKTPLFYGHLHYFEANGSSISLPAMDPDKSIGEAPCVVYYDTATGELQRSHYCVSVPDGISEYFGISCYRPTEQIKFASERGLKHLELRPNCVTVERELLSDLIAEWRSFGGECLSVHLPDVGYADGEAVFDEQYDKVLEIVELLRADRVTQHVPMVAVGAVEEDGGVLTRICGAVAQKLDRIPHDLTVGVENMHMTAKESADGSRRFGYTPQECLWFMQTLAGFCRHRVGINFDIGHARNNAPYSKTYQIGTWLSMLGEHIVGYHIHQVTNGEGGFKNHMPITQIYGSLISYASFFKCWEMGRINKAPVIFEMRPMDAYEITLATFAEHCHTK